MRGLFHCRRRCRPPRPLRPRGQRQPQIGRGQRLKMIFVSKYGDNATVLVEHDAYLAGSLGGQTDRN